MRRKRISAWLLALAALPLVAVVAFQLGRARADGVAAQDPLFYAGTLEENQQMVTGERRIEIALWDSTAGSDPGGRHCVTGMPVAVTNGRFRVPLDPACAAAVKAHPDLYVEVKIGETVLGRRKLGAVPYALEAARASEAAGPLKALLADIQSRVGVGRPRTSLTAHKNNKQEVLDKQDVVVDFQSVYNDDNHEFDVTTDRFTAKETGFYQVTCSIMFNADGPDKTRSLHVVAVVKNGMRTTDTQVASNSNYGDSFQAAVLATGIVDLKAGEYLTCVGYQAWSPLQTIDASEQWMQARNFFSVVRVD